MEEYTVHQKLGDGAQGVVYEVEHRSTKIHYAMKVICCVDQEQVNLALKEIKVLLQLRHRSIVSYVDFFLVFNNAQLRREFAAMTEPRDALSTKKGKADDSLFLQNLSNSDVTPGGAGCVDYCPSKPNGAGPRRKPAFVPTSLMSDDNTAPGGQWLRKEEIAVCFIMELCSSGDMQGLIRDSRQKMMESGTNPITEAQALSWLEQSVEALLFIHEKGFLHRDMKPTNMFFDEHKNVKIGDFGLAATVGIGRNSAVGTPYYLAPERMLQQRYDAKVDIWGLGVTLLELLTLREQPINSMVLENPQVVEQVSQQITKMGFSTKLANLVRDMLQRHPHDRPNPSAILRRISNMTTLSPHLGMSASLFAGISCPKINEALCDVCEVETARVMCTSCKAAFCADCDRARHRHHSRQSHERTSVASLVNSINGMTNTTSPTNSAGQQQTLSLSRATSMGTQSDHNRTNTQVASLFPNGSISSGIPRDREMNGKTFSRFQLALPGQSMSLSEISTSQSALLRRDGLGLAVSDTVVRVPQDCATIVEALQMVESRPYVRQIVVARSTTHSVPLVLTSKLPDSIKLIGESPPPLLEVAESPFALHCRSGKGTVVNFIIRHVGRSRAALQDHPTNSPKNGTGAAATSAVAKKPSRPTAISITGGEWRIHNCRISCVDGSGVTIGGAKQSSVTEEQPFQRRIPPPPPPPPINGGDADQGDEEDAEKHLEPTVTKCTFIDVTTAGVVLMERARGLYEGNNFSGCGFAAFLLKKESAPRIRANHITDGAEAGVFCQDAGGVIEYNVIAQNAGCGVVFKGASSSPIFRKNRVLSNVQAGVFCCDRASPFVSDNEIRQNCKAGVLIKTNASPKVTRNVIEDGREAGIYVFEQGTGIIEENRVRNNRNAGILVTNGGNPHVIHNTMTKNGYEGVWVCKSGSGTFCDNDLRGNKKGSKDVEHGCTVTWVGNVEA